MNFKLKLLLTMPFLFLLAGCGIRQKNLLSNLSSGLTKKEVKSKMGQPDSIRCPITNNKGDVIDIWEYSLATVDQNQLTKQFCASFPLGIMSITLTLMPGILPLFGVLTIPLQYIPLVCMDSPYDYNTYFLKFVNDILSKWGRASDVGLAKNS